MPQHFNFPEHLLAPRATKGESLVLMQDQGVLRLNTRPGAVVLIPLELQSPSSGTIWENNPWVFKCRM